MHCFDFYLLKNFKETSQYTRKNVTNFGSLLIIDDLTTEEELLIALFIVSKRIWALLFNHNVYVKNIS